MVFFNRLCLFKIVFSFNLNKVLTYLFYLDINKFLSPKTPHLLLLNIIYSYSCKNIVNNDDVNNIMHNHGMHYLMTSRSMFKLLYPNFGTLAYIIYRIDNT